MSPFQIVAVGVVACLLVLSVAAVIQGWTGRKEGAAWIAVWIVAGVAIVQPDLTMQVAHALGVGRGADLVLYCSVIAMMTGFFMVYSRLRRVRRDITVLTRHLAIKGASRTERPPADSVSQPRH
jgi:hypothetical protein